MKKVLITILAMFAAFFAASTQGLAEDSIYSSVDYRTRIVRVYGVLERTDETDVMLTVLNPGFSELDFENKGAINHIGVMTIENGYYDFSFKLDGEYGTYTALIKDSAGELKSEFEFSADGQSDIDKYTTTYYAPWILNWHMTTQEQLDAEYFGGEAGQMSWSMAISPTNPDLMLAGTDTNGIWRSTDGGKQWRNSSAGFDIMGTADIAFDPENENIVYALGSTGTGSVESPYAGIYKSKDCGLSWELIFANYYYRVKNNPIIKFSERDENGVRRIFVGGHGVGVGSVYSDDDGETWNALNGIPQDAHVRDVVLVENTLLFGTTKGVFVSYDNGDTFTEAGPKTGESSTVTINPENSMHWISAVGTTVYETVDAGESWSEINTASKSIASVRFGVGENPVLYMLLSLEHYPLKYSTDNGRTFKTPTKTGDSTEFIQDNRGWGPEPFVLHPTDPNILYVSFDGEIYKSEDGGKTYFASSSGYSGFRASDFLFDEENENNIYISFIDRGIVKTIDLNMGEDYPIVDYSASEDSTGIRYNSSKTVTAMAKDPKNSDRIIINIGGDSKVLKESTDGGAFYTTISSAGNLSTRVLEFNRDNPDTIYAGSKISYDDGLTWVDSDIAVMAVSPFDGNMVYGVKGSGVYVSYDEGRSWQQYSVYIGSIYSITPDLFENGTIYAACHSSFTRITADGHIEIFSPAKKAFENGDGFECMSVAQNPRNKDHLLAGGTDNSDFGKSGGIYETLDGGKTWRTVKGMPSARDIWKIEFHPTASRAYVATSAGTFVYEYEKYYGDEILVTDESFSLTGAKTEDNRSDVDCSMTVQNASENAYNAMAIYAIYDKDTNRLINVYTENFSLEPTNNQTVNKTISIGEDDFVKIYVWSDSFTPLLEKYGWQILKNM